MQRRLIWITLFSVAIVVTALYHTRKVHATPKGVCSVASLKGTYAFRRTGVNGEGFYEVVSLDPGTYTVDPDCTGTFLNKSQNIVVVDGGKRYFMLSADPGTTVTEEGTRIDDKD